MATVMATVIAMASPKKPRGRRDYGTGSLYRRASDNMWIGSITQGYTSTGARRRITVSDKTEAGARRKLREKLAEIERNGLPTVGARVTVKSWADEWLERAERTMRPGSFATARSAINLWVIPTVGHKRFADVTPADIRAVAQAQRTAGRSSSTELRTHSVLMTMLRAAMLEGHPLHPRVLATRAPKKAISDRDAMTIEQALAILPAAGTLHHGSRFLAALLQGMRQGECLGLTWPAVDLEANTITVEWQMKPLPYKVARDRSSGFRVPDGYEARRLSLTPTVDANGKPIAPTGAMHLVRPKSKAGYRVIPIVPVMRDALVAWRERSADLIPENPHDLVWPNLNGAPTYYKLDDEEWYGIQQAADVQHPSGRLFSIHEARHTTATLLLEAGVDPTVIVAIMGHSDILTTRGYQHVRTERAREALQLVATRLELN